MSDLPSELTGDRLALDEYYSDFFEYFWNITERGFWKLERRQTFQEAGSASWDAFASGDWDKALRLMEDRADQLAEYYGRAARLGFGIYRVRIVGEPITPYLQWELHSLKQRSKYGERVRILRAKDVAKFERKNPLPEIVTVGTEAAYRVLYDARGAAEGAIRNTDKSTITGWWEFIQELYDMGADIDHFFDQEVDALAPPRVTW